jgi:hypothetical protein
MPTLFFVGCVMIGAKTPSCYRPSAPRLKSSFPEFGLFDLIVAENGGLLLHPKTGDETLLGPEPPQAFLHALLGRPLHHSDRGTARDRNIGDDPRRRSLWGRKEPKR